MFFLFWDLIWGKLKMSSSSSMSESRPRNLRSNNAAPLHHPVVPVAHLCHPAAAVAHLRHPIASPRHITRNNSQVPQPPPRHLFATQSRPTNDTTKNPLKFKSILGMKPQSVIITSISENLHGWFYRIFKVMILRNQGSEKTRGKYVPWITSSRYCFK